MQKQILLFAASDFDSGRISSFQDICTHFGCLLEGEVVPVGLLQNLAFSGHPQAKHALSIRSAVCRSIARLEARDLIQRVRGRFTPTLDGRMLVTTDLTVNGVSLTDTETGTGTVAS
jgi:hypothetical protein